MPDHHDLAETESATVARVGDLAIDFPASHAMLSLYRAANSARSYLTNQVLRPHDLTWTGFLVLWLLWIWDNMETRHIAESVGISKGTLTGVTNTLVARGLVERLAAPDDKRLVVLTLTQAGHDLMTQLYPEFNVAETELVDGVSARQLKQVTNVLRMIVTTAESE